VTVAKTGGNFQANEVASVTAVLYDQTSFKLPAGFMSSTSSVHVAPVYFGVVTAMNSADRLDSPILGLGSPRTEVTTVFGIFQK
jgi:hypothetical protein